MCVCVCVSVCLCVCVCVYVCVLMSVCVRVSLSVSVYVCVSVCVCVSLSVSVYVVLFLLSLPPTSLWLLAVTASLGPRLQVLQRMERGVGETERVPHVVHRLAGLRLQTHHQPVGCLPLRLSLLCRLPPADGSE